MNARPGYRSEGDLVQLRVPPHSVDAEQAVLGGLLLLPRALAEIVDMLGEGDFYRRDHQAIWRAILALDAARRPVDALTVGDWLDAQGLTEQMGGGGYLIELATTTPSAANIRAYAEIVRDRSQRRRLIEVGTAIVNAGFDAGDRPSTELVGEAQTRIGGLLDSEPCELEAVAPVMQRVWDRLEERSRAETGGIHGLRTGIDDLDQLLGGLKPGGLYVLAARPKQGKTTLAQNIAEACALQQRKAVAVFSFEMQPEELGDRLLASQGGVSASRIRAGDLDDVDWANVNRAMQKLRGAPIYVSKPRNARVEHVVAQTRRQHAREPLGLVVIDYLQLMHTGGDNRAQGIGDITRALKLMAGELGVPVLLLSQLNRKVEERPDKHPMVSDLRDSGSIEQDADAVIFIYRDEVYDRASRYRGTAELLVPIQRSGPSGEVRVEYIPEQFRFNNLPEHWQPEVMPSSEEKPAKRGFRKAKTSAKDAAAGGDA